jgi:hypothetical protein
MNTSRHCVLNRRHWKAEIHDGRADRRAADGKTMKGDPAIIRTLNAVLTNELTAATRQLPARPSVSVGPEAHLRQIIYDESTAR